MKNLFFLLSLTSTFAFGVQEEIPKDENPAIMYEGKREVRSLDEIARLGLNSGSTGIDLWSGSYWPLYQGGLAVRYSDPQFATLISAESQFERFKDLATKLPLYTYSGKENTLSPAEKYDLVVGDPLMSLSQYSWKNAEKNASAGSVKTWRGICDGWASASQMMPRPVRSVTLTTPRNVPVTFYPDDIKALGSLLYARAQGPVLFIGKRCRSQVLGVFNNSCAETNPATFHSLLVNRVGILKKSFIADVSPGKEVWNYPVLDYKITYYNVFSEEESTNYRAVMELFDKKSKFARQASRSKSTYAIVGVKAVVRYKDMTLASSKMSDDLSNDKVLEKTYWYDLEIDSNSRIIGGESMEVKLPDFVWAPNDRTYPLSDPEQDGRNLTLVQKSQAAATNGQPLASIVEKLFESAK